MSDAKDFDIRADFSDDSDNPPSNEPAEDVAVQKINELRERMGKDFSQDEITNFITMGKQLAGKTVLTSLIKVLEEGPQKGFSSPVRLIKKIKKLIPYNYVGFVQCSFVEINFLLNVSLSLVERKYVTDIDIPSGDYAEDLFQKYNFLKNIASAYWRQFCEENKDLFKKICDYRSDIDFSALVVDPNNPTTMYFDPDCAYRVGIFCYYVDRDGRPFYKK